MGWCEIIQTKRRQAARLEANSEFKELCLAGWSDSTLCFPYYFYVIVTLQSLNKNNPVEIGLFQMYFQLPLETVKL